MRGRRGGLRWFNAAVHWIQHLLVQLQITGLTEI